MIIIHLDVNKTNNSEFKNERKLETFLAFTKYPTGKLMEGTCFNLNYSIIQVSDHTHLLRYLIIRTSWSSFH